MGTEVESGMASIGAIVMETGSERQALLARFADRRRGEGLRVAGVVETPVAGARSACGALDLLDLATGARIGITQELGPGSIACNLDPGGVALACAAVQRSIDAGADFVVLSKFGKLEASCSGLRDAFAAAALAGIPLLTTLKPALRDEWRDFAGSFSVELPPDPDALEMWWRGLTEARAAA